MTARIYSPAKTAMQSGQSKAGRWVLEFERDTPKRIEPLMGYTSSSDMKSQIKLRFDSKEQAIAYAEKHGIVARVIEPKARKRRPMAYSDNFKFDRIAPWTH